MAELKKVIDQTSQIGDLDPDIHWVSTDVSEAQKGNRVEMGRTVEDLSELT